MDYEVNSNKNIKLNNASITRNASEDFSDKKIKEERLGKFDKIGESSIIKDNSIFNEDSKYEGSILTYEDIYEKMKCIDSLFKKKDEEKRKENKTSEIINPLSEKKRLSFYRTLFGNSEQVFQLTMEFYSSFDKNIYNKIMHIIKDGKLFIYNVFDKSKEKQIKSGELPVIPQRDLVDGNIYCPLLYWGFKNTRNRPPEIVGLNVYQLHAITELVHELGHALDVPDKNTNRLILKENNKINVTLFEGGLARLYLSETTAFLFEDLFLDFLVKKDSNFETIRRINETVKLEAIRDFVAYAGFKGGVAKVYQSKEMDGNKRLEAYEEVLSMFNYRNDNGRAIMDYARNRKTIFLDLPYVLAQLIVPTFMKTYREDNKKGKEMVLEYLDRVKQDDFDGALEALGVDLKDDKNFKKLCDNLYEYMGEQEIKPIKEKKTPELEDI